MKLALTSSLIAVILGISSLLFAQDAKTENVMQKVVSLMRKSEWSKALHTLHPLLKEHQDHGVKKFGAKFGAAYYYQGLCQLKLAQEARQENKKTTATELYLKAIASSKQCYAIKNTGQDIEERTLNNYRAKALMLRGNAEQAVGQFAAAIKSYQTFLYERNSIRDTFDASAFNINLAVCFWKMGSQNDGKHDTKAETLFLKAIQDKFNPASTKNKLTGIRAMLQAYSERGKKAELEAFMVKNRASFLIPLEELNESLPYLSALTLDAASSGLSETVKTLASAIPSELVHQLEDHPLKDLQQLADTSDTHSPQIDSLPLDSYNLYRWQDIRERGLVAMNEAEELAICARAVLLEQARYYHGALAAYQLLLEDPHFTNSRHKANYLYNASRLALSSGRPEQAFSYGLKFLTDHSDHDLASGLQKRLMVTLYFSGKYDLCLALGEKVPPITDRASPPASSYYTFTLGGSYYYTGQFHKAESMLRDYSKLEEPYTETASYLYASTLGKLQQWKHSITLLDSYIARNPKDEIYIPFALYDKAHSLYSMQRYKEAQAILAKFQGQFKDSIIKPQAHILLGNIYLREKKRKQAETEYLSAMICAREVRNIRAKEEAYYLLISLLGQRTWDGLTNDRLLDTIPLLEKFLQENNAHQSPYFIQIITASFDALKRAKREQEAYHLLEQAIFLHNQKPNSPGTEIALKTYNIAKRKAKLSDEEIMDGLIKSKHIASTPYHAGLLKAAELDLLERSQRRSPNAQRAKKIKETYLNLIVEHDITALDNFLLIKIADYLHRYGGIDKNQKVAQYYQAVLNSRSKIKRPQAQVGIATALAQSVKPKDKILALKHFHSIINDPDARAKPKADAHYQLIEILFWQENYPELTTQIKAYLKYPLRVKRDIRRVEMLLALSYDRQGLTNKAIGAYSAVWVNSFENMDQSAPAIDRITDLVWQRNNPAQERVQNGKSDKQIAYETAYKYIRRTRNHYNKSRPKMTQEGIEAWERIRNKIDTFLADKTVKRLK